MSKKIESFIPMLLKTVQQNGGILDIWGAEKVFNAALVKFALDKKIVGKKTIILNSKSPTPLRIKCITLDWDGTRPVWLNRYKKEDGIVTDSK